MALKRQLLWAVLNIYLGSVWKYLQASHFKFAVTIFLGVQIFYENIVQYFLIFKNINSCADMTMYFGLSYNICGIQCWPCVIEVNLH